MEINNTKTCPAGKDCSAEGHAATGEAYSAKQGEKIWTKFTLSKDWVWTLGMGKLWLSIVYLYWNLLCVCAGVVGDPKRTSTVVSDKPFMGLVDVIMAVNCLPLLELTVFFDVRMRRDGTTRRTTSVMSTPAGSSTA